MDIKIFSLCIISLIFCIYSYPIGKFLSVIDIPDGKRKLHQIPVPQIGGIAVMVPVILVALYLSINTELTRLYIILALVSALITLLGFFDDRKNLPAPLRLFVSVLVSFFALKYVSGLGVMFLFFGGEFQSFIGGPYFFDNITFYIFTILCLVGLQNAVNMADGHNGIVSWERSSDMVPIMIKGEDDHIKTKERWNIVRQYFNHNNIEYKEVNSVTGGILSKIMCLIYVLDYSSIYYAIRLGVNPTPIKSIDFIKEKL